MDSNIKDLCRLCAREDEFSKDLMDENNKNVLKLIKEFLRIVIHDNDTLPKRICLNCEEKMVSFQLFILECYKAQDNLQKLYLETKQSEVNFGNDINNIIKTEVKDEFTTEDIAQATFENGVSLSELAEVFGNDDNISDINEVSNDNIDYKYDEEDDDISIATLKQIKTQGVKNIYKTEDSNTVHEIVMKPNFKSSDLVKLVCHICAEKMKTWNVLEMHYFKAHRLNKPTLYCLCGFLIQSRSVLYKHISDHKLEVIKSKVVPDNCVENSESNLENNEKSEFAYLKVNDYIKFKCSKCKKKCSSWYSLQAHCERAHRKLPVVVRCSCGVLLKSKSVMYKHVQDHRNPKLIHCDKCPRTTRTVVAMNKHKLRHVPKDERKFTCSSCNKEHTSKGALVSHLKSHIPVENRRIYDCDLCELKFTTRSSVASHRLVVHERVKRYVCDLCGFACGTNGELRQHRAIHSDDKPFKCPKCSKTFKTPSNLKTHMDIHEETSYACPICNKVLNSRRTLRKHLLVHEDRCTHVCSYCNRAFKRRQTLKVHMNTHTGDKPLSCQWCHERFTYASSLRSHRMRFHPERARAQPRPASASDHYRDYPHPVQPTTAHEDYLKSEVAALAVEIEKHEAETV